MIPHPLLAGGRGSQSGEVSSRQFWDTGEFQSKNLKGSVWVQRRQPDSRQNPQNYSGPTCTRNDVVEACRFPSDKKENPNKIFDWIPNIHSLFNLFKNIVQRLSRSRKEKLRWMVFAGSPAFSDRRCEVVNLIRRWKEKVHVMADQRINWATLSPLISPVRVFPILKYLQIKINATLCKTRPAKALWPSEQSYYSTGVFPCFLWWTSKWNYSSNPRTTNVINYVGKRRKVYWIV